jgi:DNA mismatch repair protein PMS2
MKNDAFDRNLSPDKLKIILQDDDKLNAKIRTTLVKIFDLGRGEIKQLKPKIEMSQISQKQNTQMKLVPQKRKEHFKDYQTLFSKTHKKLKVSFPEIQHQTKNYEIGSKVKEALLKPLHITKTDFKRMKIIGQFNKGFILCSLDDLLLIIDQHASDEKIMYEFYKKSKVSTQLLITPKKLVLTPQQEELVEFFQEGLKEKGFELVLLKESWYLIGVPQVRNVILGELGKLDYLTY